MMPHRFRIWDKQNSRWFEPTYAAYRGELEELLLSPGGDLSMRTMGGLAHESLFPGRFVICWSTGLKDKLGNVIFEGDIVRRRQGGDGEKNGHRYKTVKWVTTHYYNGFNIARPKVGWEIIGNIYENSDLLPTP